MYSKRISEDHFFSIREKHDFINLKFKLCRAHNWTSLNITHDILKVNTENTQGMFKASVFLNIFKENYFTARDRY